MEFEIKLRKMNLEFYSQFRKGSSKLESDQSSWKILNEVGKLEPFVFNLYRNV